MKRFDFLRTIPEDFYWFNEGKDYFCDQGLVIKTEGDTDFWQKTHYGFERDNGHCLFTKAGGDFSFAGHFEFDPQNVYDQCGLMVRVDQKNWIKVSTEYENNEISRLGSVVTNLGYSDWATTDISSDIRSMWYRISKKGNDFLIENSLDGEVWKQMRITHLHKECDALEIGIYACSPQDGSFTCRIKEVIIDKNRRKARCFPGN
jgi:uncharacterized protein